MSQWGACKDNHSTLLFQQANLSTPQHPREVTQYDTLLAQSIVIQNNVWLIKIMNPLTNERCQHPLQNQIYIMHIYNAQHSTTLVIDNNIYVYDGLKLAAL